MRKNTIFMLFGCMLLAGAPLTQGQAPAQYPIADRIAAKVIEKYQTSTCEQLQAQRQQPPPAPQAEMEKKVIDQLRKDPQMRQHFLAKVAGPVANKLFEC